MSADPTTSLLLVIPARGGSRGVPGKNLAHVGGVSLVGRAVLAARRFTHRHAPGARIIVDTDSEPIAHEGRRWGAEVPFLRPAELARDDTQTVDNIMHLLDRMGPGIETVMLLQPTSPLRESADISRCWSTFVRPGERSIVSVVALEHPVALAMVQDAKGHLSWPNAAPDSTRRQDHPAFWRPNGAVYIVSVALLRETRRFVIAGITRGVEMPASRSVDIDANDDLDIARAIACATPSAPIVAGGRTADNDFLLAGHSLERLVDAIIDHGGDHSPIVRFGPYDTEEAARNALEFLLPLRAVLGVPTVWVTSAQRPLDALAAIAAGVSTVAPDPAEDQGDAFASTIRLLELSRSHARTNPE